MHISGLMVYKQTLQQLAKFENQKRNQEEEYCWELMATVQLGPKQLPFFQQFSFLHSLFLFFLSHSFLSFLQPFLTTLLLMLDYGFDLFVLTVKSQNV